VNLRFWQWHTNHVLKVQDKFNVQQEMFVSALTESLRHTQIGVSANHHITYAQRPPAPKPIRLTVVYTLQTGMEYKEYTPLIGQMSTYQNFPHYIESEIREGRPPQSIRYEFGYEDGRNW